MWHFPIDCGVPHVTMNACFLQQTNSPYSITESRGVCCSSCCCCGTKLHLSMAILLLWMHVFKCGHCCSWLYSVLLTCVFVVVPAPCLFVMPPKKSKNTSLLMMKHCIQPLGDGGHDQEALRREHVKCLRKVARDESVHHTHCSQTEEWNHEGLLQDCSSVTYKSNQDS